MSDIRLTVVGFHTSSEDLRNAIGSAQRSASAAGVTLSTTIVDNGGSEVEELVPEFEFELVSLPNVGFGAAVNCALARTGEPWSFILNPDASVGVAAIPNLLAAAQSAEHNTIYCGLLLNDGRPQVDAYYWWISSLFRLIARPTFRRRLDKRIHQGRPFEVKKVCGAAIFARSDGLRELGPFDPDFFLYGEDADLSRRARRSGWRLTVVPSARVKHAAASSQRSHGPLVEGARTDAAFRLASKYRPYALSLLTRIEISIVTLLGVPFARFTSSGSGASRVARLREIQRWGFHRTVPPFSPASFNRGG